MSWSRLFRFVKVSKYLLYYAIIFFVTFYLLTQNSLAIEEKDVLVLRLTNSNGIITEDSLIVTKGYNDVFGKTDGEFKIEIISFDGNMLDYGYFDFPKDIIKDDFGKEITIDNPLIPSSAVGVQKYVKELILPYYKNINKIIIYSRNNSNPSLEIDVSNFADLCGDKICQIIEHNFNCPQDCNSGGNDNFCDGIKEGICDPDCVAELDLDCKKKEEQTAQPRLFFLLGLILALVVLVCAVLIIRNTKKKTTRIEKQIPEIEQQLRNYINEARKSGQSEEEIRQELLNNGWPGELIDKYL